MLSLRLGHGRKQWCSGFHGCGLGGLGAADRGGEAAWQDGAEGAAPDHLGDLLAASERGQVAQHSGRTRPLVAGAQLFIRWAKKGVWEDLLDLVQQRGVALGMTFIDGTSIRAHHKAAGAEKRGSTARSEMSVRRWAARVAAEPAPDLIRGHQGVRDRRRAWTRGGLHPGSGPSP